MGRRPGGAVPAPGPGAPVPAIGRALLLKDRAYELLREAIVRLDLRPGHPLTEREVSGRLGVSKSPIRDALIRLEQLRRIQNVASMIPGRIRCTHAEHGQVLAALQARDVGTARATMRAHIRSVLDDTLGSEELRGLSAARPAGAGPADLAWPSRARVPRGAS